MTSKEKRNASKTSAQPLSSPQGLEEDIIVSPPLPVSKGKQQSTPTNVGKKSARIMERMTSQMATNQLFIEEMEGTLPTANKTPTAFSAIEYNRLISASASVNLLQKGEKKTPSAVDQRLSSSAFSPVGSALSAIRIATTLAPHILSAPNSLERQSRHDDALAQMREQLQAQSEQIAYQTQLNTKLQLQHNQELSVQREAFQTYMSTGLQQREVVEVSSSSPSRHPSQDHPQNVESSSRSHSQNARIHRSFSSSGDVASTDMAQKPARIHRSFSPSADRQPSDALQASPKDHSHSQSPRKFYRHGVLVVGGCPRCGRIHLYSNDLCTEEVTIEGDDCEELPLDEYSRRKTIRIFSQQALITTSQRIKNIPVASIAAGTGAGVMALKKRDQDPPSRLQTTKMLAAQDRSEAAGPPEPSIANSQKASQASHLPQKKTRTVGAMSPEMSHAQSLIKAETDMIVQSRKRIAEIKIALAPTDSKPKTRLTARDRELASAAASGDKKFLKAKSIRIKEEDRSEDDEQDVHRELSARIKTQNFFNPTAKVNTHTKYGHVKSDFVEDSDGDVEEVDEDDEEEDEETNDLNDEEYEYDEDDSPDFKPTDSPTPSPTRSRRVSKEQWAAFQAFTKGTTAPAQVSVTPTPAQIPTLDVHNRPARSDIPTFSVSLAVPTHENWSDVSELTKVFKPAYDRYRASCGNKHYETIWETYTPTQRTRLSRFLSKKEADGTSHDYSEKVLATLSNDEFVELMCKTKGFSTTMLTETALRKIEMKLPLHSRNNWIDYEVDWLECLAQASKNGTIDPKRLTVIFREGIPDDYFQTDLKQQNFKTWQECLSHMQLQIDNPIFIINWKDACSVREAKPKPHQQNPQGGGAAQPRQHQQQQPARPPAPGAFDALTWKNSYGTLNVNPKLIPDLDMNKEKTVCDRCKDGTIHKWLSSLCTAFKDKKNKEIDPKLSMAEVYKRLMQKWNYGFFAAKEPILRAPRESPSAQDAAAASATAVDNLKSKK